MLDIHSIGYGDIDLFTDTSYAAMPPEAMDKMLSESLAKRHNGKYFELFAVMDGNTCVGVVSLYETAPETVSCGPEIKSQYRRQGYAYAGLCAALEYAKQKGYSKAAAQIRQDNAASIALHKKLGFVHTRSFTNEKGRPVLEFERSL